MKKFFNTTGPCDPERHYMLPPKERLIGADLERYLEHQLYWVLHAPRQTGKTTFLQSWMREINAGSTAVACYVSVERAQGIADSDKAMPNICQAVRSFATSEGLGVPSIPSVVAESMLSSQLEEWSRIVAPKPLVLLFDEVDVLEGPAMVSFLRQLRSGFASRGVGKFPVSVALVGMRDLRDYLAQSKDGVPVNPGSPFNIKQHSSSLGVFSREDVSKLTHQHTEATGQLFSEEAQDRIYYWSGGQPWLVNAICQMCAWDIVKEETRETVLAEHIETAKEKLILSRATHIDALAERLREERVREVVETILAGRFDPKLAQSRGFDLCLDLGLIQVENGVPVVANRVYQEVIARYLSYGMQLAIPAPEWQWRTEDGRLNMDGLIGEFHKFWRRNGEAWEVGTEYKEAYPHLLVMAFLQRVVNGGGKIEREYAAGRGRVDVVVQYAGEEHLVEIKVVHPADGRETTKSEGLEQIAKYGARLGAGKRCLMIFDRRPEWRTKPWEERLSREFVQTASCEVEVVWC